jgi:hypothetical protein
MLLMNDRSRIGLNECSEKRFSIALPGQTAYDRD